MTSTPFKTNAEPLFKLLREPKGSIVFDGDQVPSLELLVAMNG
ncbi:MAG: hypothetical protein ABI967_13400 [bacterium]